MWRKITIFLILTLVLSILLVGCQQAARRPAEQNNNQNQTSNEMTENERRVLAGRLSNLAEEVEGVSKASVVVSSIAITPNDTTNNPATNVAPNMPNTAPRSTVPSNPATDSITNPGSTTGTNANNNNMTTNPGTVGMNTPESLAPGSKLITNTDTTITNQNGLVVMAGLTLESNLMNNDEKMKTIKQTVANRLRGADPRITQVLVTSDPGLISRINDVAAGLIEGRPIRSFETDIKKLGKELQQEMPAF